MDYVILIAIGIIGMWLGYKLAVRRRGFVAGQTRKKAENKERVLRLFREKQKVVNNDVEELLGISDATAERYLDELEKEGKIEQHGKTGQSVFYTLKR